jgi:hypothetical protein
MLRKWLEEREMSAANIEIELVYVAFLSFLLLTLILSLSIVFFAKVLEKGAEEIGRWVNGLLLNLSSQH